MTAGVLAVALVTIYALGGGLPAHPGSRTVTLIAKGTYYSIPAQQFNAVAFDALDSGTVSGVMWNTWGINVYLMTPAEVEQFSLKGLIEGYVWASGRIANLTLTNLSLSISSGAWDIVFLNADNATLNPVWTNVTVVGFYSAVVLTSV